MKTKLLFLLMSLTLTLSTQNAQAQNHPRVYLDCQVREFNRVDKSFVIKLSGQLREQGWIVVKSPAKADYILTINAETRKYNQYVTKEETTYTTRKYRDTVLVAESKYSNQQAQSIEAEVLDAKAQGNSAKLQSEQAQTTVTRDRVVLEEHQTPVEYLYFVHMDAQIQLSDKNDEILYEDVLKIKDGHPISYSEAAHDAANKTIKKLAEILPTKIEKK